MPPSVIGGITEVINQMMRKFQSAFFKEPLPSNPVGPFTQALVFVGAGCVSFNDFLNGGRHAGPSRHFIGNKGHNDFGEGRVADAVGDLATHHQNDSIPFGICQGREGHIV